ncbi:cytochrome P450 [Stereum hirsutum FP-91666 SS1]|uniref:cytochrome P450 n=1 Tax=Stereum hirsutum (strain FP-91666) TaxID=721885 RepID=UPI000440A5BA|nr:cytochrome P450 [Stereum hirsutum FP-91666 SS1]EIM87080.1 cytochrome P450 [Stereum hirsutum FP-91666 SS1]
MEDGRRHGPLLRSHWLDDVHSCLLARSVASTLLLTFVQTWTTLQRPQLFRLNQTETRSNIFTHRLHCPGLSSTDVSPLLRATYIICPDHEKHEMGCHQLLELKSYKGIVSFDFDWHPQTRKIMAGLSLLLTAFLLLLLSAFIKNIVTYLRRRTLKDLRGPPSTSFWLGNEKDVRYQNEEEDLTLADPKAMQHILHVSGYNYPKRKDMRALVRLITGDGIIWTEELRKRSSILRLPHSMSHTTLDVIGEAGFNYNFDFIRNMARDIIGKGEEAGNRKDIISILLRANRSENPNTRLTDIEVVDQIQIREEIAVARAGATARGDSDLSIADLEGLTLLQAALKVSSSHLRSRGDLEGLRLHPIAGALVRTAGGDDVIPLAYPITTKSGEQISAIPISKGQNIQLSIHAYNRSPQVWGDDVDIFKPERVLEMQTILAGLLENFHFALPDNAKEMQILRKPAGVMLPMVKDHLELPVGSWMGLKVTITMPSLLDMPNELVLMIAESFDYRSTFSRPSDDIVALSTVCKKLREITASLWRRVSRRLSVPACEATLADYSLCPNAATVIVQVKNVHSNIVLIARVSQPISLTSNANSYYIFPYGDSGFHFPTMMCPNNTQAPMSRAETSSLPVELLVVGDRFPSRRLDAYHEIIPNLRKLCSNGARMTTFPGKWRQSLHTLNLNNWKRVFQSLAQSFPWPKVDGFNLDIPEDDILATSGCRAIHVDFELCQIYLGFLNSPDTVFRLLAPRLPRIMSPVKNLTLFMGCQRGHIRSKVGMSLVNVMALESILPQLPCLIQLEIDLDGSSLVRAIAPFRLKQYTNSMASVSPKLRCIRMHLFLVKPDNKPLERGMGFLCLFGRFEVQRRDGCVSVEEVCAV